MLTYIIPTHDRPDELARTLAAIGALDHQAVQAALGAIEVIVADNASRHPATAPPRLKNGIPVRVIYRPRNEGAAARNAAAHAARGPMNDPDHWLLMLDDDSHPIDTGFYEPLRDAGPDVAAVAAEIFLEREGARESGGLPEVFVGCGVAVRRDAFLRAGGYDASFGYYAEEYDLAARFLLEGLCVSNDRRFRVRHMKSALGRDMNQIVRALVRNNACVAQRYAPADLSEPEIERTIDRYRLIAKKEHAMHGFDQGMLDLYAVIGVQPRRPMSVELWNRFTGCAAAMGHLRRERERLGFSRAAIIERGKNDHLIEAVLESLGVEVVPEERAAPGDALIIGTLSPGPMLDALDRRAAASSLPVLAPWSIENIPARSPLSAAPQRMIEPTATVAPAPAPAIAGAHGSAPLGAPIHF